jgi:uncharacterized protein with FMN-binding domain
MRRPVLAVMTGLTALVVGLGVRASAHDATTSNALAAPVGVVAATPKSTTGTTTTSPSPSASPSAKAATTTVNGASAGTRYGPVQVQITVKSGRITAADAIVYPTQDPRDQEINSFAIPQLDDEVLQAQGASIDTVSGATYTSDGYTQSLQSAIDQAHSAGLL